MKQKISPYKWKNKWNILERSRHIPHSPTGSVA